MKPYLIFSAVIFIVISPALVKSASLTISQPGFYKLGRDISYSPGAGPDQAINITSSNVTLDLDYHIVSQGNATTNIDGINIATGLTDIIIQNGYIRSFTNNGIIAQSNCTNITLSNLFFESIGTNVISLTSCTGGKIYSCRISNCLTGSTAVNGILLTSCNTITINNCLFNNNGSATRSLTYINISGSNRVDVLNTDLLTNQALGFVAIALGNATQCMLDNCTLRNNSSVTNSNVIVLSAGTSNNILKNITVDGHTAAGSMNVIDLEPGTQCYLENCLVQNTSSTGGNGIYVLNGNNISLFECKALGNTTANGNTAGFISSNVSNLQLVRCNASFNTSSGAGSVAWGLNMTSNTLAQIQECQFNNNTSATAANSYGVQDIGPTQNNYIKVSAVKNGGTAAISANQLNGVPAADQVAVAFGGAGITGAAPNAWSNLAIIN